MPSANKNETMHVEEKMERQTGEVELRNREKASGGKATGEKASDENKKASGENNEPPAQRPSLFGMAVNGLRRTMGSGEDARNEDGTPKQRLSLFEMRTSMTAKLGLALDEDTKRKNSMRASQHAAMRASGMDPTQSPLQRAKSRLLSTLDEDSKRKDSMRASQHAAMRASGMDPTQSPLQRAKSRLLSTLDEPLEIRNTKKLSQIELSPDFKKPAEKPEANKENNKETKPQKENSAGNKNQKKEENQKKERRMSYLEREIALQNKMLADIQNKQENLASSGARPSFIAQSIEASVIAASKALSNLGDIMGVEKPNANIVDVTADKDESGNNSDSSDSSSSSDSGKKANGKAKVTKDASKSLGPKALDLLNRRRESRRESRSATPAHGASAVSPTMSPRQRFLEEQRKMSVSVPPITKPNALSPKMQPTRNQPTPSMRPVDDPLSGHLFALKEGDREDASSSVRDNSSTRNELLTEKEEAELKALKEKEEEEGAPNSPRQSFAANPKMMPLDLSEGTRVSSRKKKKHDNRSSALAQPPRRSSMFAGIIPGIAPGSKADESALFLQDLFFKMGSRLVVMFFFIWCGVMFYHTQLAINHGAPELPELEMRAQRKRARANRYVNRDNNRRRNSINNNIRSDTEAQYTDDDDESELGQFDLNSLLDMDAETRKQILAVLNQANAKKDSSKKEEDL